METKIYFRTMLVFLLLGGQCLNNKVQANSIDKAHMEVPNVTPETFNVPGAGWYRVGELFRGSVRVVASISGGAHEPQTVIIDAFKNWNSKLSLRATGINNNYIEEVRLTYDGGLYYIEIYIDRALVSNSYLYHYEIEGYQGAFTLNSGTLPIGGGEVKMETHNLYNNTYTSGGLVVEGYVGIGTSNPDEALTVNGNVHASEVRVDLSVPAPDYVFAPEYQLRSLKETEEYIKANSHLPEVPSAKEMEANGIELGEMNMLLLKKIEELTLHLIEQQKELALQKLEIEVLKKKSK